MDVEKIAVNRFDNKRIDITDQADIVKWAAALGLTQAKLTMVITEVGTWLPAIERKLSADRRLSMSR